MVVLVVVVETAEKAVEVIAATVETDM